MLHSEQLKILLHTAFLTLIKCKINISVENKLDTCHNNEIVRWSFGNLRVSFVDVRMSCCPVSCDLDVDCHNVAYQ